MTKGDSAGKAIRGIFSDVEIPVIGRGEREAVTGANAVFGKVGIGQRYNRTFPVSAATHAKAYGVTRAEEVVFLDIAAEDDSRALGHAETGTNTARRLLFNGIKHVDLIVGPRHFPRVDLNLFEMAEAFQANFGMFNQIRRRRRGFHLAHFPTQHFVVGFRIATKLYATYVGSFPWIDIKSDRGCFLHFVHFVETFNFGKGIALRAEPLGK